MQVDIHENPFKLWKELTIHCLRKGTSRKNDKGEELKELLGVPFHIRFPLNKDEEIESYFNEEMTARIEYAVRRFNTPEPEPRSKVDPGERIFGKTGESPYNRVKSLLIENPESKKATISLVKDGDLQNRCVYCIVAIDFKVRDGRLNLYYFARSQDIFKKSYADNIALAQVQKRLAADLSLEVGTLSGYIASAHIYKSDLESIASLQLFKSFSNDTNASVK